MAGGQWEVVGKSKKTKQKNGTVKATKEKKKLNTNFEVSGPISESQTIYTYLDKDQNNLSKPAKSNVNEPVKSKASQHSQPAQQKKKKDKKSSSPSKLSLEEVFAEVTEEDLKNLLATLELLSSNPLVWLKDVASFLNVRFDAAVEDPVFSGKPLGYPSILLNKKVHDRIIKTFNRCSPSILELFFEFCLQSMVQDTLKGIHTLGYRVVLQCLAQEMPSVATANISKCVELCMSHHNRQNICLSVMWAAGQAGNNNLEAGLHAWTELMFPMIGTKTCTAYAVDYLERLVCCEDLTKLNKSILGVKDLFHILDFIYSKELVKSVQKRLISCYPTLKAISYGPEPENNLRNYFPSYLHRLDPHGPQALREEILSSLVYCLEKDIRTYSIWRQLYIMHFKQSRMLIAHLNEHWEELPPRFPRKCLFDTLSVFQVTNEEMQNCEKKIPGVEECILINKELLTKINSQMFSWVRVMFFFVLICSVILTFDILTHNSFAESHTGRVMKDAGLLTICAQAGEKLTYYYGKTSRLLQKHVPTFNAWLHKTFGPYVELFFYQLMSACVYIWKSSTSVRTLCSKYIHSAFIMVDTHAPFYGNALFNVATSIGLIIRSHMHTISHYGAYWFKAVGTYLSSNELILNSLKSMTQFAGALADSVQQYTASVLYLIKSYIPFQT